MVFPTLAKTPSTAGISNPAWFPAQPTSANAMAQLIMIRAATVRRPRIVKATEPDAVGLSLRRVIIRILSTKHPLLVGGLLVQLSIAAHTACGIVVSGRRGV